QVTATQVRHDFYFGANGFIVQAFPNASENELFEKRITRLFNLVTIPLHWPELEPEQGKLRFDKPSEPISRRPPPDLMLEFCQKYNLTPTGHTLVWDHPVFALPKWLPQDETEIERLTNKRIDEIADRYGTQISIWD